MIVHDSLVSLIANTYKEHGYTEVSADSLGFSLLMHTALDEAWAELHGEEADPLPLVAEYAKLATAELSK